MARHDRRLLPRLARLGLAVACVGAATGCFAAPDARPAAAIDDVVERVFDVVQGEENIRAILVAQHGTAVYQRYQNATPEDAWDIRQATMTVTSTLIGLAIDRGLIADVDATLAELLPDDRDLLTSQTADITLHALLTHTAGFPPAGRGSAQTESDDGVADILAERAGRDHADEDFRFSPSGARLLGAVVAEATGLSPLAFARESLFDPLGIDTSGASQAPFPLARDPDSDARMRAYESTAVAWPADAAGINLGDTHLRLRPVDLLSIGQLFLDEGEWRGKQVISSEWVRTATWPIVATGDSTAPSFGYGWWVNDESGVFFTHGTGGTVIAVHPAKDAVVVIASEIAPEDPRGTWGVMNVSARALAMAVMSELPER
jgi:CubicO group peptidase (beta-lactamase class C family)